MNKLGIFTLLPLSSFSQSSWAVWVEWAWVSPAVFPPILGCDEFESLPLVIVSLAEVLFCLWTGPSWLCSGVHLRALGSPKVVSQWCRRNEKEEVMGIPVCDYRNVKIKESI